MNTTNTVAALFDFDGVVMDTEPQYTLFWNEQGRIYLHQDHFGASIKGQTLTQIYEKHFSGELTEAREWITRDLGVYERAMIYEYIPGVQAFISDLRNHGVKIAIVTSSDEKKMANVYRVHPTFKEQFDCILLAGMFQRSKPAPDCFLLGMETFGTTPQHSFVFEDSFHGLQAGRSSGATVIGLATTNLREAIADKADFVIDNFSGMTYEKLLAI